MRVTKTEYTFDGDPAEFKEVAHLFEPKQQHRATEAASPAVDGADQEEVPSAPATSTAKPPLSETAVKAMFQKRALTSDQAAVVKVVHKAGDSGTTTEDIAAATGFDRKTVKAALRLLGKRVYHTQEWPKDLPIFRQEWEGYRNRYWLHDAMRTVLDSGEVKL